MNGNSEVPVVGKVRAEDLGHVLLERGVYGSGGVDLADGQVGGGLLADEDVDAVVGALPDGNDQAEEELVVGTNGGELKNVDKCF